MTFKTTMKYHLAVKWLRLHAFTAEAVGLIPGWVTKILQAEWHGQKKKKEMKINPSEWLLWGWIVKNWKVQISCAVCAQSLQLCPTLCNPMDYSLPGSSVPGILQVRILKWVAVLFSREIFPTQGLNPGLPHCRQILYQLSHQESIYIYIYPFFFIILTGGAAVNNLPAMQETQET